MPLLSGGLAPPRMALPMILREAGAGDGLCYLTLWGTDRFL